MAFIFRPIGTLITGTVRVVEGSANGKKVRMALYKRKVGGALTAVPNQDGDVFIAGNVATYLWDTAGVLEDTEWGCEIGWDVWFNSTPQFGSRERTILYRRRAEISAVDKDGAPFAGAGCRVRVTVDPEFTASGRAYAAPQERDGETCIYRCRTNKDGLAVFDDLPYGKVQIDWVRPHILTERAWHNEGSFTEEGPKRKAEIEEAATTAAFVWPTPPAAPLDDATGLRVHTQFVNMDPTQKDPYEDAPCPPYGSPLVVKVRVANRPGVAGDHLYVKIEADPNNSVRTADPRPMVGSAPLPTSRVLEKTLAADDEVVEFPLALGPAGCDRFVIRVGGAPGHWDDSILVVTRRKVYWRIVYPSGCPDNAVPKLPAAIIDKVREIYAAVGIDLIGLDPIAGNGTDQFFIATGANAERLQLDPAENHLIYTTQFPEKSFVGERNDGKAGFPLYPACLHLVIGAKLVAKGEKERFLFSNAAEVVADEANPVNPVRAKVGGRAKASVKSPSGGFFLERQVDGSPVVLDWQRAVQGQPKVAADRARKIEFQQAVKGAPRQPSHWCRAGDDTSAWTAQEWTDHTVTEDFLVIDRASSNLQLRFEYPADTPTRPGTFEKTIVKMLLQVFETAGGSSSGRWTSAYAHARSPVNRAVYGLTHEIGHWLGLVVKTPKADGVGKDEANIYAYELGPNDGVHCSHGLTATQRKQGDWRGLSRAGTPGDCVMYSPVGPKTPYDTIQFCDVCKDHLKKTVVKLPNVAVENP